MARIKIVTTQGGGNQEIPHVYEIWDELETKLNSMGLDVANKMIAIQEEDNISDTGQKKKYTPLRGSVLHDGDLKVFITPKQMKGAVDNTDTILATLLPRLKKQISSSMEEKTTEAIADALREVADHIENDGLFPATKTGRSTDSEDDKIMRELMNSQNG